MAAKSLRFSKLRNSPASSAAEERGCGVSGALKHASLVGRVVGTKAKEQRCSNDGGAADLLRFGMKRVLLSLCLSGAVISAPIALDWRPAQGGDPVSVAAISNAESPFQSIETVVIRSEQDEVHAVVVDMPQEISLAYADPKTWGDLPMALDAYEEPAATPGLQFAMNLAKSSLSH